MEQQQPGVCNTPQSIRIVDISKSHQSCQPTYQMYN